MARFQVASDLHLEFLVRTFGQWHGLEYVPGTDGLILAGDIAVGDLGVRMFADWPVPVFMVPGNHESYGQDVECAIAADLWVHGHTHCSLDYAIGRSRVVCNPRGYPRNLRIPGVSRDAVTWENTGFSSDLVVEV